MEEARVSRNKVMKVRRGRIIIAVDQWCRLNPVGPPPTRLIKQETFKSKGEKEGKKNQKRV